MLDLTPTIAAAFAQWRRLNRNIPDSVLRQVGPVALFGRNGGVAVEMLDPDRLITCA